MSTAVNSFIQQVSGNKMKCIKRILRIKNGFKVFKDSIKMEDCEYRDIKINVLIGNKNNSKQIMGFVLFFHLFLCLVNSNLKPLYAFVCVVLITYSEIQFLIGFMLDIKRKGHSLYGIARRKEFIDNVKSLQKKMNGNI